MQTDQGPGPRPEPIISATKHLWSLYWDDLAAASIVKDLLYRG
jgi:hypothetical protein